MGRKLLFTTFSNVILIAIEKKVVHVNYYAS